MKTVNEGLGRIIRKSRFQSKMEQACFEDIISQVYQDDPELSKIVDTICKFPSMYLFEIFHIDVPEACWDNIRDVLTELINFISYNIRDDGELMIKYSTSTIFGDKCIKHVIQNGGKYDSRYGIYHMDKEFADTLYINSTKWGDDGTFVDSNSKNAMQVLVYPYIAIAEWSGRGERILTIGDLESWLISNFDKRLQNEIRDWAEVDFKNVSELHEDTLKELEFGKKHKTYPFYYTDILGRIHWNKYSRKLYKYLKKRIRGDK